jgi:hypothetical protein
MRQLSRAQRKISLTLVSAAVECCRSRAAKQDRSARNLKRTGDRSKNEMAGILKHVVISIVLTAILCAGCGSGPTMPSGSLNVSGAYSLTITVSPSCTQLVRIAQFGTSGATPISLTQSGPMITGALSFINPPVTMTADMSGQILSGNAMTLTVRFFFSSSHDGTREASGSGVGVAGSSTITGTFNGNVTEFDPFSSVPMTCDAADQQFVLVRVGS